MIGLVDVHLIYGDSCVVVVVGDGDVVIGTTSNVVGYSPFSFVERIINGCPIPTLCGEKEPI